MTETVITISRRFEMCIRRESPEDAVSRIADYLDDRIESNDQKKAIAEYMERNYSIKWPWVSLFINRRFLKFQISGASFNEFNFTEQMSTY